MKWLVAIALMTLTFAGCLEGGNSDDNSGFDSLPGDVNENGPAGTPAAGSPASHGEPTIAEGPEETYPPEGNQIFWEIRQAITIDNDFGGAALSDIDLALKYGDVVVSPSDDGDYHYWLQIVGYGGTQSEAQAAFDSVSWDHMDSLGEGVLTLNTWIDSDISIGGSCQGLGPLTQCAGQGWRGIIMAEVPAAPAHDVFVDTIAADVAVTSLGGPALAIDTTSGDMALESTNWGTSTIGTTSGDLEATDLVAASASIETTSGDVSIQNFIVGSMSSETTSGDFEFNDFVANSWTHETASGDVTIDGGIVGQLMLDSTSADMALDLSLHSLDVTTVSGSLEGRITPTATGTFSIATTSGDVDLRLPNGSDHGYDVDASTTSGDLHIVIADSETVLQEEDRVHVRSVDFSSHAIRTTMGITTSSGDVTVQA